MKIIVEMLNRYFQMETGAIYETAEVEEVDEPNEEIRLPIGFQPPPVSNEEGLDNDEEYEAPEADCR
jgi:hypothetical protein